ncbi:hypothetical protein P879_09815 [Paragonimus westermani]|uniref:Uncharacterized protein n=1 Tax=Paragonimus westermani TaxID=34504 RepID=A0A8T0DHL3_9TREM|nr:hypothetical protein P879_09815 [Paragonimus westermani]
MDTDPSGDAGVLRSGPFPSTVVSGQPSAVNARYPDGIGLPVALAGGSRGTQCFKTPSVIRLARILCPDLIRPLLLARRPARHASSTGSKTLSMDTSSQAENALSLNDLKTAAQPIIARLSDPSSLLLRPRPRPPVNQVIATVAARKNISLHSLDLSAPLNSVQSNGPILATTKRPRSSSPDRNDSGRRNGTELDTTELVNGTGGQDSASPPPCKKQAIGVSVKCPNLTETSNGLLIEDGTDDQDGQHF